MDKQAKPSNSGLKLDGLLQIPDRGEFEIALARLATQSRAEQPLAVILLDVDHFKQVNDSFGHLVGDEVLKKIAESGSNVCDGKGQLFRYGGEELVALLPNHTVEEAEAVAQRFRENIEQLRFSNTECVVTASFGVAALPQTANSHEEVLRAADEALYASKRGGRNQVTVATSPVEPSKSTKRKIVIVDATQLALTIRICSARDEEHVLLCRNGNEVPLSILRISLQEDGVELLNLRPPAGEQWAVEPQSEKEIRWNTSPGLADYLIQLHPTDGLQFSTVIDIDISLLVEGRPLNCRRRLAVLVFAASKQVRQKAG